MRHQLADCDFVLAIGFELRPVFKHRIFQANLALLQELHHRGRRGDHLGQRRHIKNRVDGHRFFLWFQRPMAEGTPVDHLPVVPDLRHRSRALPFSNGLLNHRRNGIETFSDSLRRRPGGGALDRREEQRQRKSCHSRESGNPSPAVSPNERHSGHSRESGNPPSRHSPLATRHWL